MIDVPGSVGLPSFWEMKAYPSWESIDFISDLHLSAHTPRTFEAWAAHLRRTRADAVFILGDLFEVWVGDDARHSGFEARCAEVLAEAAAQRTVAFMAGNRDFLVGGLLLKECGVMALSDPTVLIAFGERLLLTHGDSLCLDDVAYQAFRRQVRGRQWQAEFLAQPLEERRRLAGQLRDQSRQHHLDHPASANFDIDCAAAVRWMHEAGTPTLIHGHTHRPAIDAMAPGYVRHVLSDWDLDDPAATPRAEVLRLRRGSLSRVAPAT